MEAEDDVVGKGYDYAIFPPTNWGELVSASLSLMSTAASHAKTVCVDDFLVDFSGQKTPWVRTLNVVNDVNDACLHQVSRSAPTLSLMKMSTSWRYSVLLTNSMTIETDRHVSGGRLKARSGSEAAVANS